MDAKEVLEVETLEEVGAVVEASVDEDAEDDGPVEAGSVAEAVRDKREKVAKLVSCCATYLMWSQCWN